jgi:gluconolactonase
VVDSIDGVGLNAPNDVCVDSDGGFWFSDPSWAFADDGMAGPGTVCYVTAGGQASRVHTGLRFPNGVALTDGGSTLLITESSTGDVWAAPVSAPGVLGGEPQRFGSLGEGGLPDGMALDAEGRVLVAGHGTDSIHVIGPDGATQQRIHLGDGAGPSNLCFGGPDNSTVYVTAANPGTVLTFPWICPGLALPF